MDSIVLDASAVPAVLQGEPGAYRVIAAMEESGGSIAVSAVNFCEVMTKLVRDGLSEEDVQLTASPYRMCVAEFTLADAERAGDMDRATSGYGLSLGDRACLALAAARRSTVLTADRAWAKVGGCGCGWS